MRVLNASSVGCLATSRGTVPVDMCPPVSAVARWDIHRDSVRASS